MFRIYWQVIFIVLLVLPLESDCQVMFSEEPTRLSEAVNSEGEESLPLLSNDGLRLFFARSLYAKNSGGKYGGHDIWVSDRIADLWGAARSSYFPFNSKENEAIIGLSSDGNTVYLMRTDFRKSVKGIYFSRRISGAWTSPELIPIGGLSPSGPIGFYVSQDFDVIFISMNRKDGLGQEDLYVSTRMSTGNWSPPANLGSTINTAGFEIAPFLSQDKKRLYFSSSGHEGLGDGDIFVSEKLHDSWDVWSIPKNLGSTINSKKFDAYFSCSGDSVCFFVSNRIGNSGDIYKVKTTPSKKSGEEIERMIAESKLLLKDVQKGDQEDVLLKPKSSFIFYEESSTELLTSSVDIIEKFSNYISRNAAAVMIATYDLQVDQNEQLRRLFLQRWDALKKQFINLGVDPNSMKLQLGKIDLGTDRLKNNCFYLEIE